MRKTSDIHTTTSNTLRWIPLMGVVLFSCGCLNTYVDIARYGLNWGLYFWFCNLALVGMGLGLMIQSRGLILGFVSIAAFTQSIWLIDSVWQLVTHQELFGLVNYLYQPGLPIDEFILSHYHYFTIALGCLALCFMPKKGISHTTYILIFNPLIFAISYFCFPKWQNVNCIHDACFTGLSDWTGPVYSIGFWLVIFSLHLVISQLFDRLFSVRKWMPVTKAVMVASFQCVIAVGVVLTVWDTHYKLSLPSLTCDNKTQNENVALSCRYTRYVDGKNLMLTYLAKNSSSNQAQCVTKAVIEGTEQLLSSSALIDAFSSIELTALVPSPTTHATLSFKTECKELSL